MFRLSRQCPAGFNTPDAEKQDTPSASITTPDGTKITFTGSPERPEYASLGSEGWCAAIRTRDRLIGDPLLTDALDRCTTCLRAVRGRRD